MLDSASKFGNIASYFERAKEKYCPDLGFGFSQVVKLGGGGWSAWAREGDQGRLRLRMTFWALIAWQVS